MSLASTFREILQSLPGDWTDIELDLRVTDERRYLDAALILMLCNAQPYSGSEWHWRVICAHSFGHGAAPETIESVLHDLDEARIDGQLALRQIREGRVEAVNWWGLPASARQEFARRRAQ